MRRSSPPATPRRLIPARWTSSVYPPIPTDDWTVQNLPDRMREVRQLYLDTLGEAARSVPKIGPCA